ncbi:hypothetical protein [Mesorhizobium sp. M0060]|uniref:hypothetical protein n=1 Tax=Mesorhizobium sp. M0060 TaxID=2956866 RepID=UPI00333B5D91
MDQFLRGGSTQLDCDMAGREANEPTGSLDSGTSDEILSLFGGFIATVTPSSGSACHRIRRSRGPTDHAARWSDPRRRCGIRQKFASERHELAPTSSGEPANATHALRGIKVRSALTVLGIAVGVAAQASAVQFSADQQNGATPEERSRIGENHAMNSEMTHETHDLNDERRA